MDEYAYNKIFVGGLHYDTRDGKYATYVRALSLFFNKDCDSNNCVTSAAYIAYQLYHMPNSLVFLKSDITTHHIAAHNIKLYHIIPYSITFHHTASYNLNNIKLLLNCIIFVAEFRAYFERFGRVMSAEVMFNRETHKSRGFGFIVFELEKGAEHVCAEREHIIDGKVVSYSFFMCLE